MLKKTKICVVTGTRAEYGLLYWLMKKLDADPAFELQIIATGMHLSPEFGLTYQVIEEDGFRIDEKLEILLSSDTPVGIAKAIGLGTIGFADAFTRLLPDFVVVLGDRFEILAAAQAALVARIPIVHIAGGDTTEGAIDEAIRHSVTKMSHVHFVSNPDSARRVRQLGENPDLVFEVGNPGLDHLENTKLLSLSELEKELNFKFRRKNILVTFHPVTLENDSSSHHFTEVLKALKLLDLETGIIFTKSNADTHGRVINKMIDEFVARNENSISFVSLGQLRYLSTVSCVDAVVGNSSSGLLEVPSFKKPTVNIGDRQKGRLQPKSVIQANCVAKDIFEAIGRAFAMDCKNIVNPYGDGRSTSRMIEHLRKIENPQSLIKKHFFDWKANL